MSSGEKQKTNHEKTSQTCDVCKLRHQKCNGVRPSCYYCLLRGLQCNYSRKKPRKNDQSDVRRKVSIVGRSFPTPLGPPIRSPEAMEKPVAMPSYERVHDILVMELAGVDLPLDRKEQLSRAITEKLSKQLDSATSDRLLSSQNSATEATADHLAIILAHVLAGELGLDVNNVLEVVNADIKTDLHESSAWTILGPATTPQDMLPTKFEAHVWLDKFLNGPNKLFYACDPQQSHQLVDALYSPDKEISPISHCLISFQIALGALYSDNVSERVASAWYDRGRQQMENCIEKEHTAPLWVVQALVLSTIYSMNTKPRMSWLSLSSAIRLAQTYRIDLDPSSCHNLTAQEYLHWRQIWLSIILIDVWLAIFLGRTPQITENTTQDRFLRNPSSNAGLPDHSVNVNMAKLAVITGRILRDVYAKIGSTFDIYESTMQDLEEWSSSLPPNLRFHDDRSFGTAQPGLPTEDLVSSKYYLKMYYLASVSLLTRPLLLRIINPKGNEAGSTTSLNIRFFAQSCTDAAIQLGHVSSTMVKGGFICKRSWLVTILNYHAGLLLILSLSGKRSNLRYNLSSVQDQSGRQLVKGGLDVCGSVLAYCAQQDPFANHYLNVIKMFQGMIETYESASDQRKFSTSTDSTQSNQPKTLHSIVANAAIPVSEQVPYEFAQNFNSSPLDMRAYPSYPPAGAISDPRLGEWTDSSNQPSNHLSSHSLNQLASHCSVSSGTHQPEYPVGIGNPYITWEQPNYGSFDSSMEGIEGNHMRRQNDMSYQQPFNQ